ncbi:MAG: FKBP-type peptidyl-prolyl cis-trans isomerase, partial [Lysobacterales bacterium]
FHGEKPRLTPEEAAAVRKAYIEKRKQEQAAEKAKVGAKNLAEGQKFLAENKTKPGVKTTASGLQYQVIKMGEGPKPKSTDTVKVNYRGTLLNGTEFDSSYARKEPISFALDRVIPGWTEGLQLMPVGSKFKFFVKPELAYGENGGGPIPPNATLIFDVELLGIEDAKDGAKEGAKEGAK